MKQFSVCMIAKNEGKNIGRCLESLKGISEDIVVVDTGSTDNTKEIAEQYGARVYDFDWINDFSAARNYSIQMAKNNWILVLDCDEWITECHKKSLYQNASKYPYYLGMITIRNLVTQDDDQQVSVYQIPRFFDRRNFEYRGAIHEQLEPIGKGEFTGYECGITIMHSGYLQSEVENKDKRTRNMEILKKVLEKNPEDAYYLFQMGQEYYCMDRYEEALSYYRRTLDICIDPQYEYVHMCVYACGRSLLALGKKQEAMRYVEIYDAFATTADFLYLMGLIYFENEQYMKALGEFVKATTKKKSSIKGTNTYCSWYYIGLINEMFGDRTSAEKFYRMCGDYEPARKRLEDQDTVE